VLTAVLSIGLGMLAAWAGLTLGARLGGVGSSRSAASPASDAGDGDREAPESKDGDR